MFLMRILERNALPPILLTIFNENPRMKRSSADSADLLPLLLLYEANSAEILPLALLYEADLAAILPFFLL